MEKRLQIDIHGLKESYSNGELSRLGLIPGYMNPADSITKISVKDSSLLTDIMRTNRLTVESLGWATVSRHSTKKNCATVNYLT